MSLASHPQTKALKDFWTKTFADMDDTERNEVFRKNAPLQNPWFTCDVAKQNPVLDLVKEGEVPIPSKGNQ